MSQRRRIVGGSDGYTVMLTEELDADGNQIAVWFEIYGPDGEWLSSFPSEENALAFVESQVEHVSTFRPK